MPVSTLLKALLESLKIETLILKISVRIVWFQWTEKRNDNDLHKEVPVK